MTCMLWPLLDSNDERAQCDPVHNAPVSYPGQGNMPCIVLGMQGPSFAMHCQASGLGTSATRAHTPHAGSNPTSDHTPTHILNPNPRNTLLCCACVELALVSKLGKPA